MFNEIVHWLHLSSGAYVLVSWYSYVDVDMASDDVFLPR